MGRRACGIEMGLWGRDCYRAAVVGAEKRPGMGITMVGSLRPPTFVSSDDARAHARAGPSGKSASLEGPAKVDDEAAQIHREVARAGNPVQERSAWSTALSSGGVVRGRCAECAEEDAEPAARGVAPKLLTDDDEEAVAGVVRKTDLLAQLRVQLCTVVDDGLAGTGRDSQGCPWIDHWLGYYERRSAADLERAILKYAPEAAGASRGSDYIHFVTARVRRSVDVWVRTGQMEGMPDDMPENAMPGGGVLGAFGGMFFKAQPGGAREADPASVRDQLGSGQPLPGDVRSRMGSAFGTDFSHVRLHTDRQAAQISKQLNARAFTLGEHVAFGAGQYVPGTLAGDALIAHELAHVVQQAGAATGPQSKSGAADSALEEEADSAAISAVTSIWSGSKSAGAQLRKQPAPRLRSTLRLQRCSGDAKKPAVAPNLQTDKPLRATWEVAFQQGLALLNESVGKKGKQKGCVFPGAKPAEQWAFDQENWRQVTSGDEFRKYRVAFEPTKVPHVSVDELFAHLERWECDCALFGELTWLYAWRHTLPEAEFDRKFSNMHLRPQETTGLERETHVRENIELGIESGNFDQMWAKAPVGTKVNWKNESLKARTPWGYENAVKSRKGATPDQDLYDAHPIGANRTEEQIKRALAENSEDFPGNPFVITDQTLAEMAVVGAPADFVRDLEALKGQKFFGKREFSIALTEAAKPLVDLRAKDPSRYVSIMERLFASAHEPATEEEKQKYIDKNIRRYELQIPK
jgi:hypothetical protein